MAQCTTREDIKFRILSGVFGLIIGSYWLLRPIKDAVFFTMVGKAYQPTAKLISLVIVGLLVLLYSKLVDHFPRHKLLYGYSLFYACATAFFAVLILHPTIGLSNTVASSDRYLGWLWYFFVESFGSTMVALFWSFVSDTTTPDVAKNKYFTVVMGGQLCGFIAPLAARKISASYGTGFALIIPVIALFVLVWAVYYYMGHVKETERQEGTKPPLEGRPKIGFLEGARLLLTRPYLLGILAIVTFYEIVVTILDYHFKVLASTAHTGEALTNYLYGYALWTNGVALVCLALGVGSIGRKLGLTRTIILLPILVSVAVILFYVHPILPIAFIIMVSCKGLNYALIQPSKEQLYIPTTKQSRYKAKAWIDMFGLRSSKGVGAAINNCSEFLGPALFASVTTIVSLGLVGVWIVAALFIGRIHAKAVKEDRLVC